ncbi:MAG TPA: hypothetical protein VG125_09810 [Pirellulales bacterium]|nr:hypothetical protein [Pirellulales bacterium]
MSRRFQFSLRAMMVVVTMAAVAIWAMKLTGPFMFFAGLVCYGTPVWLFLWLHGIRCFTASRDETD